MRYNAALMMALVASERREVVVVDMGDATLNLPTSFPHPEPLDLHIAEALDKASAALEASKAAYDEVPWDLNWKPTRGRVVSQAKGPNRAQRRGR